MTFDRLPSAFGPYLLLYRIGSGGMGDVFLASRGGSITGIDRLSVVKTLRPQYAEDHEYVTRFIDEARVVVQLSHKNICQVHDVGKIGNTYFLAMEHIAGRDMKDVSVRAQELGKGLTPGVALHVVAEAVAALDYAHRIVDPASGEPLHLVHRDVSPRNIMMSGEGEVKLIDFGLAASRLKQSETAPSFVMGKIAYMAPEQARHEPLDARADVYAAGVVLYELLTGERFYGSLSIEEIWSFVGVKGHKPVKLASLDPAIAALVKQAVAFDRNERFATADAFREAIERVASTSYRTSARDLREVMAALFPDDQRERQKLLAELLRISHIVDDDGLDPMSPTETMVIATRTGSFSSEAAASSKHAMVEPPSPAELLAVAPTKLSPFVAPPPSNTVLVERKRQLAPAESAVETAKTPAVSARPKRPAASDDVDVDAIRGSSLGRAAAVVVVLALVAAAGVWIARGAPGLHHRATKPIAPGSTVPIATVLAPPVPTTAPTAPIAPGITAPPIAAIAASAPGGEPSTGPIATTATTRATTIATASASSAPPATASSTGPNGDIAATSTSASTSKKSEIDLGPAKKNEAPKTAKKKRPPPPADDFPDRLTYVKKWCQSTCPQLKNVDASSMPLDAFMKLQPDVDKCIEQCASR